MNHVYIDGTKLKANAGNYTWVWKKSCIKNGNKVSGALTQLLWQVNEVVKLQQRAEFETRQEYTIEYVEYILQTFLEAVGLTLYETLAEYRNRLKRYNEHMRICGEKRNSYCKTDHDATFMRVKRDYMGNDQRKARMRSTEAIPTVPAIFRLMGMASWSVPTERGFIFREQLL